MIIINGLYKSFHKSNSNVPVLSDLNIKIEKGKMTAIMGRSGAGKTTLLNILCGLIPMDAGEYYFDGQKIDISTSLKADKFRNHHFGIVTQKPKLLKDYTVYENIALPLQYTKMNSSDIAKIIMELTSILELENKLKYYPDELSGGQQQRVAIARALCKKPEIILADEPTGSLDSSAEVEIMNLFKKLNDCGITIAIVTHSNVISEYCDNTVIIKNGQAF